MIDIKQFAALQKKSKASFTEQRQLLKKVMAGQTVLCSVCQKALFLNTLRSNNKESDEKVGVCCKKGCTDILLDFA